MLFKTVYFFSISVLLLATNTLVAQGKNGIVNDIVLEGKFHYGTIQPHHSSMRYLIDYNTRGVELSLSSNAYGRHAWEELYRFPRFGVSYMGLDLGNKEMLGYAHSLFGFLDAPIYIGKKGLSFRYEIDFGVGYLTKIFDVYDNPLNLAIGSHINMMVGLDLNIGYQINDKNEIKAGLDLTHLSNGKMKTPNLGYNLFTLNLAYLYTLQPKKHERIEYGAIRIQRKNFVDLTINGGSKTDDMVSGKSYFVSSLVADYWYAFSRKYLTGAGLDFFYDPSVLSVKEHKTGEVGNPSDAYQIGLHGSFSARYNRLFVLLHVGAYVHSNYITQSQIFSRFGFRYMLSDKLYFNFTLKAHKAIADYIEWGVGVRL